MKVINHLWINSLGSKATVGIVLFKNDEGKYVTRILGFLPFLSLKDDLKYIEQYGTKLTVDQAKGFFPNINDENYES